MIFPCIDRTDGKPARSVISLPGKGMAGQFARVPHDQCAAAAPVSLFLFPKPAPPAIASRSAARSGYCGRALTGGFTNRPLTAYLFYNVRPVVASWSNAASLYRDDKRGIPVRVSA
jgi:hypothetical protein